ncbi:unnamed protein product [Prorocentrum cordatum]|nr:unnamed protein product [Polarella glacialis]
MLAARFADGDGAAGAPPFYAVAAQWFDAWRLFVAGEAQPPGPVANGPLVDGSAPCAGDVVWVRAEDWRLLRAQHGGGPVLRRASAELFPPAEPPSTGPQLTDGGAGEAGGGAEGERLRALLREARGPLAAGCGALGRELAAEAAHLREGPWAVRGGLGGRRSGRPAERAAAAAQSAARSRVLEAAESQYGGEELKEALEALRPLEGGVSLQRLDELMHQLCALEEAQVATACLLQALQDYDRLGVELWLEQGSAVAIAAGTLDIHVVYFATGTPGMVQPRGMAVDGALAASVREQRSHMRRVLSAAMSPKEDVLSLVTGDFNWVAAPEDRMVKSTGEFSGADDAAEQREAMATLWSPAGLYEVRQDEPTHECAQAWSQLDRCYWNADLAGQLDRDISCTALEWVPHLSAHRAIAFGRRTPARRKAGAAPVRPEIVAVASWSLRVAAVHQELRQSWWRSAGGSSAVDPGLPPVPSSGHGVPPLRDLAFLKQAMRITADWMLQESSTTAPEASLDDNVGHTLRFIRAAERGATGVMQQCLHASPRLGTLVPSPLQLASARGRQLQPYRQLAVELARDSALEELSALQAQRGDLTEQEVGVRRSRILTKLKKLAPGRSGSLAGVASTSGDILTDPKEMADALRQHWQDVFAQRPVDEQLLEQWVRDDAPPQVPPPDAGAWALRRSHVQKALEQSPNSALGPDGLSFAAWRRLGPLAVDVLWNAPQAITMEAEAEYFEEFITTFNTSLMVFLPKGAGATHRGLTDHKPAALPAATKKAVRAGKFTNANIFALQNKMRVNIVCKDLESNEPFIAAALKSTRFKSSYFWADVLLMLNLWLNSSLLNGSDDQEVMLSALREGKTWLKLMQYLALRTSKSGVRRTSTTAQRLKSLFKTAEPMKSRTPTKKQSDDAEGDESSSVVSSDSEEAGNVEARMMLGDESSSVVSSDSELETDERKLDDDIGVDGDGGPGEPAGAPGKGEVGESELDGGISEDGDESYDESGGKRTVSGIINEIVSKIDGGIISEGGGESPDEPAGEAPGKGEVGESKLDGDEGGDESPDEPAGEAPGKGEAGESKLDGDEGGHESSDEPACEAPGKGEVGESKLDGGIIEDGDESSDEPASEAPAGKGEAGESKLDGDINEGGDEVSDEPACKAQGKGEVGESKLDGGIIEDGDESSDEPAGEGAPCKGEVGKSKLDGDINEDESGEELECGKEPDTPDEELDGEECSEGEIPDLGFKTPDPKCPLTLSSGSPTPPTTPAELNEMGKQRTEVPEVVKPAAPTNKDFATKFHDFGLSEIGTPLFARPPVATVEKFRGAQNYAVYSESGAVVNVLLKCKAFRIITNPLSSQPPCPNYGWAKHGGAQQARDLCARARGFDVPMIV